MSLADSTELFLCSLCLWREARGESVEAKQGIWFVLNNRAKFPGRRWPKTLTGVILQHAQFTSFSRDDPNSVKFPDERYAQDWAAWLECCSVVENPPAADPTQGACYYEAVDPASLDELRAKEPWFAVEKMTVQLGSTRFYLP